MEQRLHQQLLDEAAKLRDTGEALLERVEDVAASIRYLTNELLTNGRPPEADAQLARVTAQAKAIAATDADAAGDGSPAAFAAGLESFADRCGEIAHTRPAADDPIETTAESNDQPCELPEDIAWRIECLVNDLKRDAAQLASAEALGSETVRRWWEKRLTSVRDALWQLDHLEEKAVEAGMTLRPHIERLGGVPDSLRAERWPDALVLERCEAERAAWEAEQTTSNQAADRSPGAEQKELFGAVELAAERAEHGEPGPTEDHEPLSAANAPSEAPPEDADCYTLDDYREFCDRGGAAPMTATVWRAEYGRLRRSQDAFCEQLLANHNATQLKTLALRTGVMDAKRQTKAQNAASVYRRCLAGFVLGGAVSYSPMSETYEEAVDRLVEGLTDEDFARDDAENEQRAVQRQKALDNPEDLREFALFVRELGEERLSDEQHLRRDRLYADLARETRARRQASTVERFASAGLEGLTLAIKEGYHDKRRCPVWVVQLGERVERDAFNELKRKAAQLGGWYSSFKKADAGFQFLSEASAEKFVALAEGDADRREELDARSERKLENTAERFAAMASRLTEQARTALDADDGKLKNTARRAAQAASSRAAAYGDLATAATLQSVSATLADGRATYLDGVRHASQIATLRGVLRRAKEAHDRRTLRDQAETLSPYERSQREETLDARPADDSDIRYAEYPWPQLYLGHLQRAFERLQGERGAKQATARMRKLVDRQPTDREYVCFRRDDEIELLGDFIGRARAAGYDCYWFENCDVAYKRLAAAGITDAHLLRAALAELLPHLHAARGDDPVTRATDALRGVDLPGFYPTPRPLARRMVELARIEGDDRVLEPSCGMGDLLDAVRREHPDVELTGIEQNHALADVLAAKGYEELVTYDDFLEHRGPYDKVVMNPPFENGRDIDHVRHAFELLAVGGRVVAVMSEGPFFRADAKSRAFRDWLATLDHAYDEALPEGTFTGPDAFRQTGVRTRLVVLDKTA